MLLLSICDLLASASKALGHSIMCYLSNYMDQINHCWENTITYKVLLRDRTLCAGCKRTYTYTHESLFSIKWNARSCKMGQMQTLWPRKQNFDVLFWVSQRAMVCSWPPSRPLAVVLISSACDRISVSTPIIQVYFDRIHSSYGVFTGRKMLHMQIWASETVSSHQGMHIWSVVPHGRMHMNLLPILH